MLAPVSKEGMVHSYQICVCTLHILFSNCAILCTGSGAAIHKCFLYFEGTSGDVDVARAREPVM